MHLRVPSPRPSPPSRVLWLAALLLGTATAVAQFGSAAGWWSSEAGGAAFAAPLLPVLVVLLWRRHITGLRALDRARRQEERTRQEAAAAAEERTAALRAALAQWSERLRAVLDDRDPAPAVPGGYRTDGELAGVLEGLLKEVRTAKDTDRETYEHAVVFLTQRVQSGALQLQNKAETLTRSGDPDLVSLGMEMDHQATFLAHLTQSLRLLCGEWTGQQWRETVPLTDVVRAAAGRITEFRRVDITGEIDMGVKAQAAEWVIHLVAELLSNATLFSAPRHRVSASVELVQRGAVIQIDDRGLGMNEGQLETAHRIASGRLVVGLRDLDTPQIGLPVTGVIARRFDIEVGLDRSPYGGVRAVVLVPQTLLEVVDPAVPTAERPAQSAPAVTRRPGDAPVARTETNRSSATAADTSTPSGLPQRTSRRSRTAAPPPSDNGRPAPAAADAGAEADAEQCARFMHQFLSGSPAPEAPEGDQ
ncbi:ATP-binding protein [Streptomyces meridianus]|uniref:histidine kinase n=1 Tax=Streptomyces meridianus TaxID=2938945 RepID=A0ABT0X672_9ACTN|nr:ATP-binding protein [Streptomyces meridianus]MCM2577187.1 hypothetical protein [Streptomyces meridianus]